MSFEWRDYLRHILAEADYLVAQGSDLSVVQNHIPKVREQLASLLEE